MLTQHTHMNGLRLVGFRYTYEWAPLIQIQSGKEECQQP